MIYGSIKYLHSFGIENADVIRALEYAASHDLSNLAGGRHDIDGDALYFNAAQYVTASASEKKFEAHRAYLDVHYLIDGTEQIHVAPIESLRCGEYDASGDFFLAEGEPTVRVTMRPGDFLVCYPEDGHCPGIRVNEPEKIRKVIFKVRLPEEIGG